MWFIILLDKSTVIKDGLIGSPLNETNLLFEFTVLIFRFYVFENLSKLCSAPWLFSGTRRNSFRVGVFWFRTSWWFPFYMFQLVLKQSFESAMSSGNYEKERDCFGRLRERKLSWLACTQLLLPFLRNLVTKSDFIKTKISCKNCEKTFLKNIF